MEKVFSDEGTFAAYNAATKWCADNGYSVGAMQAGSPTGVIKGDHLVSKWRYLSRADVDGTIEGNFREGPVTLKIAEDSL